jgi:DNA invertase Pin-like site-specific DNA recombinase
MESIIKSATTIASPQLTITAVEVMPGRVGYERLSKDRSLRRINVSIQQAEIDDYAEETGGPIATHFEDNDRSASEFASKERKGYPELLFAIRNGEVAAIIVTEIPRLTRQSEDALELIALSKTTPLRYITTTDGMIYDLHTPRGRKAFRDAVSDAQFESDQSSSRQHRKKNKQAEAGMYHGGGRPYGYEGAVYEEFETEDGEKVRGALLNAGRVGRAIIEEEAAIRRECTQRIIAGEREIDIVRDLNRRGVTSSNGAKWRAGNLKSLLTKKHAVAFDTFPGPGTRVHKDREYRAVWPAIISKEDYELMMAAFKLKATYGKRSGLVNGRRYPYSGILRCGGTFNGKPCLGPMYGNGRYMSSGHYQRRYVCKRFDGHGEVIGCGKVFRSADPIELLVKEAVIEAFDSPEVAAILAPKEDKERVSELVGQQGRQQAHLQQLAALFGAGGFFKTPAEYATARDAAQAEFDETEAALAKIQTARAVVNIPAGKTIRQAWDQASIEWVRSVTLLIVDYILIEPGNPGGHLWNGYRFNPDNVKIIWKF